MPHIKMGLLVSALGDRYFQQSTWLQPPILKWGYRKSCPKGELKPYNSWDVYHLSTSAGFLASTSLGLNEFVCVIMCTYVVYVYICIVHMYVCMNGWMYVWMDEWMIYIYMCVCTAYMCTLCMYLCMSVCMYVCACVCMYVCIYVCMYVRMYVRTYVCMDMYVCMYV